MVGPLPDYADFVRVYAPLARDASTVCEDTARHWPGLFINVAHGSYGMASCPVSGELPPLPQSQVDCLNPARFIIRELKKQQVSPAAQSRS